MSRNLRHEPEYAWLIGLWDKACHEGMGSQIAEAYWRITEQTGDPVILESVLAQFGYLPAKTINSMDGAARDYEDAIAGQEIMNALTGV